jgi:NAD(P)-dependent dehydrogenase (short-subunit alcohol dehydrogenase family)
MPVGLITGASQGLGFAIASDLIAKGWSLIVDARDATALKRAFAGFDGQVASVPGDVADPAHRTELASAAQDLGRLDLLVNNASELGPSPLPPMESLPTEILEEVFRINTIAPLAIVQQLLPLLGASNGIVINVSSDAAIEAYAGWGGYGASKAALDLITAVIAVERPGIHFYSFDPGDMRTAMHQRAYPGQDISDRPLPETVVPAFVRLLEERPPSGRYRAADLLATIGGVD